VRGGALPLTEPYKRITEVVLRIGPAKRCKLTGCFLKCVAKGCDRLFEETDAALALAEPRKRSAEIILGFGPNERQAVMRANVGDFNTDC
jgi:hypothetical protein